MRTLLLGALVAAPLAFSAAFAAQPLLPAGGSDQVPLRTVSLPAPDGRFERAPVSFSWALDPADALATPAPHRAQSREYWQTVDGDALAAGIAVDLTAAGALIRVSPARGAHRLDASELQLVGQGRNVRLQRTATDAELQAAGMAVGNGTVVVRVADDQARGRHRLRALQAQGRYVVHVFEPNSPIVLTARAGRSHALGGETVAFDIDLRDAGRGMPARAEALLVAPDGSHRTVPVTPTRDGGLVARVRVPTAGSTAPGLWELQVFATGDGVQRDARTAFAVAAPTARLLGHYTANPQQLRLALPIEAGAPGRYEARGTLYATGPDRLLRPVSQAHSAAWFDPGDGLLVLEFDRRHMPGGYGAPFEVRQLELHDQTRMAPLEIRERGARF